MLFHQPLRNNSFVKQYRVGQRLSEGTNALIDTVLKYSQYTETWQLVAQSVRVWTCAVQNVTGFEPRCNPLLCVGDSSPRIVSVHSCNLLIGYKWSKRARRSCSNSSEWNDRRPKRRQIVFLGKVYENWNAGGSHKILAWCSSEGKHSYVSCAKSDGLIRQPMNSSASTTALIWLCTKRQGFCRSCR